MAKDILGREIDPNTTAGAYRKMADNTNVMQAAGKGARTVANTAGQALQNMGSLVNQSPKLIGTPAAGLANLAAAGGANFMTGFTGQKYVPNTYEGKTLTQLFSGGQAPAAPTSPAPAAAALPTIEPNAPSTYVPGTGLPSAAQIASDKSRALLAQRTSDEAMGLNTTGSPLSVNATRQANGVMSFSGSGPGTGVSYTGTPNWTSQRGGAGQGQVISGGDLAGRNANLAGALQGIQSMNAQAQRTDLIDRIASGSGGAIGVAQNKMALAGLGDMLDTQSKNATALSAAGLQAETQRRGQDIGAKSDIARTAAILSGQQAQAGTAREQIAAQKDATALRLATSLEAIKAKSKTARSQAEEALLTRKDPATGKRMSDQKYAELYQAFLATGSQGVNSQYLPMMQGFADTSGEGM